MAATNVQPDAAVPASPSRPPRHQLDRRLRVIRNELRELDAQLKKLNEEFCGLRMRECKLTGETPPEPHALAVEVATLVPSLRDCVSFAAFAASSLPARNSRERPSLAYSSTFSSAGSAAPRRKLGLARPAPPPDANSICSTSSTTSGSLDSRSTSASLERLDREAPRDRERDPQPQPQQPPPSASGNSRKSGVPRPPSNGFGRQDAGLRGLLPRPASILRTSSCKDSRSLSVTTNLSHSAITPTNFSYKPLAGVYTSITTTSQSFYRKASAAAPIAVVLRPNLPAADAGDPNRFRVSISPENDLVNGCSFSHNPSLWNDLEQHFHADLKRLEVDVDLPAAPNGLSSSQPHPQPSTAMPIAPPPGAALLAKLSVANGFERGTSIYSTMPRSRASPPPQHPPYAYDPSSGVLRTFLAPSPKPLAPVSPAGRPRAALRTLSPLSEAAESRQSPSLSPNGARVATPDRQPWHLPLKACRSSPASCPTQTRTTPTLLPTAANESNFLPLNSLVAAASNNSEWSTDL